MRIRVELIDKLVSEYIRKKSGGFCQRCGRYYGWKNLQACHFHGRSRKSVRYDEENLVALDFGCHVYLDSHPMEKVEFFKALLGEQPFDLLNSRARILGKPDKQGLTLYYREKIKGLDG